MIGSSKGSFGFGKMFSERISDPISELFFVLLSTQSGNFISNLQNISMIEFRYRFGAMKDKGTPFWGS